jgi:hypothetical protein
MRSTSPREATLIDILVDGFEKNEVLGRFHDRSLPLSTVEEARTKFESLCDEATRWKGEPLRREHSGPRQLAVWSDLEIRQAGRGVLVLAAAPCFDHWWHDASTWADNPMGDVRRWVLEGMRERER